jgi:hypothetical protein
MNDTCNLVATPQWRVSDCHVIAGNNEADRWGVVVLLVWVLSRQVG